MNIKRIAIIKGFNQESNKEQIEKVVIFYENGLVETKEYNRLEHLRLIANYLFENGMDILDDGLRKGMSANLISIVNREDELAMNALNSDILEANILHGENSLEETKVADTEESKPREVKAVPLTDEFRELTRYFTLSKLRDRGNLTGRAKKDIDRAIKELRDRNERVLAIEETRDQFLEGNISEKSYREVYEFHRNALSEAIKAAKIFKEEIPENQIEENKEEIALKPIEEEKEEEYKPKHAKEGEIVDTDPNYVPKHAKEEDLTPEEQDLKDYLRLLGWDEKRMLPPVGQKEMREIEERNERARNIAEARKQRDNNIISAEEFKNIVANQGIISKDEKTRLNEEIARLSREVNDLKRYIKLLRFDERKQLSTPEQVEMKEIEERNERAEAIAEVRRQRDNNNLSDEKFKEFVQKQRVDLVGLNNELQEKKKARDEQEPEKDERSLEIQNLSKEVRDLTAYLKLLIQDENKQLSELQKEEMKEIEGRNERAEAIAEARRQRDNNNLSDENYRKVVAKQRQDLNDEYRRLVELERMEGINREDVEEPAPAPVVPETDSNKAEEFNNKIDADELKDFDNENDSELTKELNNDYSKVQLGEEDYKDNYNKKENNKVDTNKLMALIEKLKDRKIKDNKNKVSAEDKKDNKYDEPIEVEGTVEDPDKKDKEEKEEKEEKGFVLYGEPYIREDIPSKANKRRRKKIHLPSLVLKKDEATDKDKNEPKGIIPLNNTTGYSGRKVVGRIPSGEKDPVVTEEEVVIPADEGEAKNKKEERKVKVKKRNRVWAAILGAVVGIPLIGWLVSKLVPGTTKGAPGALTPAPTETPSPVSPTPQETNEAATPTPAVTVDTTVSDAVIVANSIQAYADRYNLPAATREFLFRADVVEFLSQFKNADQRNEVISALAFGYEMNYLTHTPGIFKQDSDKGYDLNSYCFDFMCAKAYVNGYTPEQMAVAFGTVPTFEQLENGFHNFYNMLATYSINGTVTPPFRYLTNGETKDCKALNQLFHSLMIVNAHRKNNTLTSEDTDNFIVTCDKLYGRGSGTEFTTEGAAQLGMSIINGYNWGQANIAYGQALVLQKDHGTSRAGLKLSADENGHWEIDGFNYYDLFTQANRGWGNADDYNSRCYNYKQRMAQNLEKAREIANGNTGTVRESFAAKLEEYPELEKYAEIIRSGNYDQATLDAIYEIVSNNLDKYPHFITDLNTFIIGHNSSKSSEDLVSIDKYAQEVDHFFGIGLRDDYDMGEVMSHYINQVYQSGPTITFTDENGNVIGGNAMTGLGTSTGIGGDDNGGPGIPVAPPAQVTTTTTTQQVSYEDLTPAEQSQAQEQIQEQQQQEDEAWEEQIDHAQEVADEVTTQYHDGEMTQQEAQEALEQASITVDPHYFETMDQIHEEEVAAQQEAQEAAQQATQESVQAAETQNEEVAQEQEENHDYEEDLIQQSLALEAEQPAPAPVEEQPAPAPVEEQPAPAPVDEQPQAPADIPSPDEEIDPEFGSEDEQPYTGRRVELEDYRRIIAELKDFGIGENTSERGHSLKL